MLNSYVPGRYVYGVVNGIPGVAAGTCLIRIPLFRRGAELFPDWFRVTVIKTSVTQDAYLNQAKYKRKKWSCLSREQRTFKSLRDARAFFYASLF